MNVDDYLLGSEDLDDDEDVIWITSREISFLVFEFFTQIKNNHYPLDNSEDTESIRESEIQKNDYPFFLFPYNSSISSDLLDTFLQKIHYKLAKKDLDIIRKSLERYSSPVVKEVFTMFEIFLNLYEDLELIPLAKKRIVLVNSFILYELVKDYISDIRFLNN